MGLSRRIRTAVLLCATATLTISVMGVAQAAPASVDNVVSTIASNVANGKWGVAEKNIESLDKTIRNELKVNKAAVAIASNPVQDRLNAVNERLALIKADYAYLHEARTRIDKASVQQANALIAQLRLEMVQKLNLINARGAIDALDAIDTDGAQEIAATAQRLQTENKAVKYLGQLLDDLKPAIREAENDRTHLTELNRKFTKVLSSYGLSAGGAAVAPAPAAVSHVKILDRYITSFSNCPGGFIDITQNAKGVISAIVSKAGGGSLKWTGHDFAWTNANTLTFAFTMNGDPGSWAADSGTYSVVFSADNPIAMAVCTRPDGFTGNIAWRPL